MKILFDKQIKESLAGIHPTKIAVAYIGANWRDFLVSPERIEAVIVSPTLGTNPHAVSEMVRFIGWEKIHFLDELHAKLYIGEDRAVTGSSNLTRNGLIGGSLLELCVELKSVRSILKLNIIFEDLLNRARSQYPAQTDKEARLVELERQWNNAISNEVISPENVSDTSFSDFNLLADDQFYVLWYQPGKPEFSEDAKKIESVICDWTTLREEDHVKLNKWVLMWRLTTKNAPDKRQKLYWLYIHEIIRNGVINEEHGYTTLAAQRIDKAIPEHPFEITKDVEMAFKEALELKVLQKFLVQCEGDTSFSLEHSTQGLRPLITTMKKLMRN